MFLPSTNISNKKAVDSWTFHWCMELQLLQWTVGPGPGTHNQDPYSIMQIIMECLIGWNFSLKKQTS